MAAIKQDFEESQKFTQWWVWLILIGAFLMPFIIYYDEIKQGQFTLSAVSGDLSIPLVITFFIVVGFLFLKLKTTINDQAIKIHYFPILKKEFKWEDIQSAKVIKYTFWQVGGWGFRFGTRYGMVYNVRGTLGIHLKLKDGRAYLIGTQKPKEAKQWIEKNIKTA